MTDEANPPPAGDEIVVLITAPSSEAAAAIARALVGERLAACANLVGPIRSIYRWEGEVHDEPETLLLVKTRAPLFERLRQRVVALHAYSCPEIVALPITRGHAPYLRWIGLSVD